MDEQCPSCGGGGGRIRTFVDVKSADLQSAAIDRSATPPLDRLEAPILAENPAAIPKSRGRRDVGFLARLVNVRTRR